MKVSNAKFNAILGKLLASLAFLLFPALAMQATPILVTYSVSSVSFTDVINVGDSFILTGRSGTFDMSDPGGAVISLWDYQLLSSGDPLGSSYTAFEQHDIPITLTLDGTPFLFNIRLFEYAYDPLSSAREVYWIAQGDFYETIQIDVSALFGDNFEAKIYPSIWGIWTKPATPAYMASSGTISTVIAINSTPEPSTGIYVVSILLAGILWSRTKKRPGLLWRVFLGKRRISFSRPRLFRDSEAQTNP